MGRASRADSTKVPLEKARNKGARGVGSTEILVKYPHCTIVTCPTSRQFSKRNKQAS